MEPNSKRPALTAIRNGKESAASTAASAPSAVELHRLAKDLAGGRRARLDHVDEFDPDGAVGLVHRLRQEELGISRDRQGRGRAAADVVLIVERAAVQDGAMEGAPVGA